MGRKRRWRCRTISIRYVSGIYGYGVCGITMSPRNRQSGSRGTRADQGVRPTNISVAILLLLAGPVLAAGATRRIKVHPVGYWTGAPPEVPDASHNSAGRVTVRPPTDCGAVVVTMWGTSACVRGGCGGAG